MTITPDLLITKLAPFIREERKNRIEEVINHRFQSIQLAIEAPSDIHNALASVRSCEAFGILNVHFIAVEGGAAAMSSVTKGTFYWVNIHFHATFADFMQVIKKNELSLAGGVLSNSRTVSLSQLPLPAKLCILLGNEQRGLSEQARQACDILYQIPMVGMVESLNLSVCAAVSLFELTQRKRGEGIQTDLNLEEATDLRAKYYLNSVDPRLAKSLLSDNS